MPCYYPIDGWRSKSANDNGRYPIVFKRSEAQQDESYKLPCGKCIGCRLDRSGEWAIRCLHESKMHEQNCFLTLTFADEYMPTTGSVSKRDLQLFFKRFRSAIAPKKISYLACGEYGEHLGRPHYHAVIFGYDFQDKKLHQVHNENNLYTSKELENYWPYGHNIIGEVTYQSAAYVARYTMKKVTGDKAQEHYKKCNPQTGEIYDIEPEFLLSSRNPAIGRRFLEKYPTDLEKGFLTVDGKKRGIPKYYQKKYPEINDFRASLLKSEARLKYDPLDPENCGDRLRVKEKVKLAQITQLKRSLK